MIHSLKDEKYIVPFNMSREAFLDCFKEYALQHKLLPLSFFNRSSIEIQGYYIPTYLFKGKVDAQWLATRYSVIKTTKAAGLNNQRLENSTSTIAKPIASNSVSEFSVLAPSCRYSKIPIFLWNYLNGYNFDITIFRDCMDICNSTPSVVEQGIEVQTIDNEDAVVWEDYAKRIVIQNAHEKQKAEIHTAGLDDPHINCYASCDSTTHIIFLPCWLAQIRYGKKLYYAISVANVLIRNLSCSLPDSLLIKHLTKLWNILAFFLLFAIPIYCVKYARVLAQTYLGYHPKFILSDSLTVIGCWIVVFILGFIIWRKVERLIEAGVNKLRVYILRSLFSKSGIH